MELSHNNPISMRYDYKKRHSGIVNLKREERQRIQTTENPERIYFLWFLSLKLILEMEDVGLGKSIIGKYKIDREFYKEWNLEEVLNVTHYEWWKTHQTLFESPPIVERDNLEGWTSKEHYRYLRVDLRNNYSNIKKGVLEGIDDLIGQKVDKNSKYPVTGKPQYDNEILSYNIMVRKLNLESNESIFEQEIDRFKVVEKEHKSGLNAGDIDEDGEYTVKKSKLMTSYDELQSGYEMSPEQKEITKKKVRKPVLDEVEEVKYYERLNQSLGLIERREFDSLLGRYIKRNKKQYQKILCGVSQGQYRVTDLEYQKKYRDKF